jgi:hypothetical protein
MCTACFRRHTAKYQLLHNVRVHTGQDDESYDCMGWGPDGTLVETKLAGGTAAVGHTRMGWVHSRWHGQPPQQVWRHLQQDIRCPSLAVCMDVDGMLGSSCLPSRCCPQIPINGVWLNKTIPKVASKAVEYLLKRVAPKIMTWSQYAEAAYVMGRKRMGYATEPYIPDWCQCVDHFALHSGAQPAASKDAPSSL